MDVLAGKFSLVVESGLEGYWVNVHVRAAKKYIERKDKASLYGEIKKGELKWVTKFEGTLADSMIRESFCLLAYGFSIALLGCVLEFCVGSKMATVDVYFVEG